jgi:hypothetical protein
VARIVGDGILVTVSAAGVAAGYGGYVGAQIVVSPHVFNSHPEYFQNFFNTCTTQVIPPDELE